MPYICSGTALGDGEGTGWWRVGAEVEGVVKVRRGVVRIARGGQSTALRPRQSGVVFLIVPQHLSLQALPRTVPVLAPEHGELDSGVTPVRLQDCAA
jgi:hypothetical protein